MADGTDAPIVVLATRNAHKGREFARQLPGIDLRVLPDSVELPPETGDTYAANALPKAQAAAQALGVPAIADDSGIEAAALGGMPGVRSARFAGEYASDRDNLNKLIAGAPAGTKLEYVCAIAYVDPSGDGIEQIFEARCPGTVAAVESGNGGFGYDPIFLPDGAWQGRTMAELSDAEKDSISHRGVALRAFLAWHQAR